MIVAVHQPQFLPWLGYFDKIHRADIFCYLDNVQFKKNDWQNRNRIKNAQGWQWLTVPVHFRFPQKIKEVAIDNAVAWTTKHLRALTTNYSQAPYFKRYAPIFEQTYSQEWELISDLNIYLIQQLRNALDLDRRPTFKASEFDLREDPTDRLIDICKALYADTYLSGQDGINYMDLERFRQNGIRVVFQKFNHPVYTQIFNDFQSHMSVVDLLFNCGPNSLAKIMEANPRV